MTTFPEFDLDPAILTAVEKLGFESATPVQAETIPALLDGRDLIGQARTGSGKTAAFGLPMLQRLKDGGKPVRGLVLTPTRELTLQVTEAIRTFAKGLPVRVVAIYGGAPYPPQLKALRNGACIVVGTPGRVIDHLDRGSLDLSQVETFVLDEADEMLRMGFLEPVEHVLQALPETRQIALFSATMPAPIQKVSKRFLVDPVTIQVESTSLSVDHIDQFWIRAPQRHKINALLRILQSNSHGATLVFTRTRKGCAEVADGLTKRGIAADAIHGDLNQAARERVIHRLRSKSLSVLVATDVAARGLDVSHLSCVINFDYPNGAETYVHRIGRTGRAGAQGRAITLVTPTEQRKLRYLQKAIKYDIQEMQPPSNAELSEIQRSALWAELEQVRVEADLKHVRKWLDEVRAESGVQPKDIAAAAIQLLTQHRGIDLSPPKAEPPSAARRQSRGAPGEVDPMARVNEVELFLNIGRHSSVRPADIVGALANEVGISGSDIGRINLFDKKSFVGLPSEIAKRVLSDFPVLIIRGIEVHLSLARPRQQEDFGRKRPKARHHKKGARAPHKRGAGSPHKKRKGKK